ncbi:alpha/beta hydrolase [Neptunicella sp. SCSIO 80796]|uniref:alpha/beta hydrolase n=1 Tax=Neptunicella plasticusilytica TaxID=3117012 RepID=UPI003A4E08CC
MHKSILLLLGALLISVQAIASQPVAGGNNAPKGSYDFTGWQGGKLSIYYSLPPAADKDAPILIVIPGARRNADVYRDQWHSLAMKQGFIVLAIGCSLAVCPSEYDYNLGGLMTSSGKLQPAPRQFFSAPELVFNDFKRQFQSSQPTFALYGHSAGGGFVHLYMLARPDAPVSHAVSANAAFFTYPDPGHQFPFGLQGSPFSSQDMQRWLAKPLTLMLGDQDLGPRTKPVSNSDDANAQGRNVFARGLSFYAHAINTSVKQNVHPNWQLEVVHGVGHNSGELVPYALKYLFPQRLQE